MRRAIIIPAIPESFSLFHNVEASRMVSYRGASEYGLILQSVTHVSSAKDQ